MRIAAVYLPAIGMDGDSPAAGSSDLIHLEADIAADADNPNGFPKDGFIPYLRIEYRVEPPGGGPPVQRGPPRTTEEP